jgi:hypothetical protein
MLLETHIGPDPKPPELRLPGFAFAQIIIGAGEGEIQRRFRIEYNICRNYAGNSSPSEWTDAEGGVHLVKAS